MSPDRPDGRSAPAGAAPGTEPALWKRDWPAARRALEAWWAGRGPALHVTAPREEPWEAVPPPPPVQDLATRWLDPVRRTQSELYRLSRTFFGGVAFPLFSADVGPGSLGLFLGARPRLDETTVWYEPSITDPEASPPLRFDPGSRCWREHVAIIEEAVRHASGRYLVGMPDLIENLDTLAQLRGPQATLTDLVERPGWVLDRIAEINQAYFRCFDLLRERIRDPWGGNSFSAFALWGLGRTAKVQCDLCCAISPAMFRRFVRPALEQQCAWLDHALFHLDGTQALPQLPNLLAMENLSAIEWTPQSGLPGGGSPEWYRLYREIRAAGKSVQAVGVALDEVEPLLDAVGPEGMFVMTSAPTQAAAEALLARVGWEAG